MFADGGALVVVLAAVALMALLGVLPHPPRAPARLAARRPAAGRRRREPDRPRPAGRGHRLHRPGAVAGLQRGRRRDHLRGAVAGLRARGAAGTARARGARRRRPARPRRRCRDDDVRTSTATVPPEAAGERLDVFLAAHAGSRSAAQRLIDGGAVRVDGAARPKRHVLAAGARVTVACAGRRPERRRSRRPRTSRSPTRTSTCWWSTSPPGVVVHPGRGHARGTLVQALAGGSRAARTRSAPASCTDSTATRPGCSLLARSDPVHAALQAMLAGRLIDRGVSRPGRRAPGARWPARSTPRSGATGACARGMSTDTDEPRPAITHFDTVATRPGATLLRVRLRDRPHPPDPRPPAGDRPPRARRPGVRRPRPPRARSGSSCTPSGSRCDHPGVGRAGWTCARRCRRSRGRAGRLRRGGARAHRPAGREARAAPPR